MSVDLIKWSESNVAGNDMGNFLAGQVQKCTQIDILTGYFFFDGITEVQKALFANKNIKLRILVGMDAGIDVRGLVGRVYEHELENHLQDVSEQYIKTLETFFAKFPSEQITPAQAALFAEFSDMIKENRLEIKKTAIANHSKLYIFHEENGTTSFCGGSSNFSYSGLTGRQEFNIHVEQDQERAQEVQEQPDLFADHEALAKQKAAEEAELAKERRLQDALLSIKKQFGKNAVLKAMSLQEGATAKDRNQQVGGHKA